MNAHDCSHNKHDSMYLVQVTFQKECFIFLSNGLMVSSQVDITVITRICQITTGFQVDLYQCSKLLEKISVWFFLSLYFQIGDDTGWLVSISAKEEDKIHMMFLSFPFFI